MRRRGSEGKGADKDADQQARIALGRPPRRELHAHRIDQGERRPDHETARHGRPSVRVEHQKQGVRRCAGDGADRKQTARIDPVREPERSTRQPSGDEAELHRQGQQRDAPGRKSDLCRKIRRDRRDGEPKRERGDLREGDQRNRPSLHARSAFSNRRRSACVDTPTAAVTTRRLSTSHHWSLTTAKPSACSAPTTPSVTSRRPDRPTTPPSRRFRRRRSEPISTAPRAAKPGSPGCG